jgi:putative ABC transport system ATP-binding protein
MADHVIVADGLRKIYQMGDVEVQALRGLSCTIDRGEVVAIVGPSGSGKSTLMNILGCLDHPTSGDYYLDGEHVSELRDDQLANIRNRKVGFVFQSFNLLSRSSALTNVELPLRYSGNREGRKDRAREALTAVGLGDRMTHRPTELSGGQQQRVAIARALANDPPILIADEPTGNLDSGTAASVFALFDKLVRQGKTIVMVTHDQDLVRQVLRTIYLKDGRITGDQSRVISPSDRTTGLGGDEKDRPLHLLVSRILDDPPTATQRLREALKEIPKTREEREALYQAIFEEIKLRADQAEQSGDVNEARKLWGILVDATGK